MRAKRKRLISNIPTKSTKNRLSRKSTNWYDFVKWTKRKKINMLLTRNQWEFCEWLLNDEKAIKKMQLLGSYGDLFNIVKTYYRSKR